jgi:hypothetical protein
MSCYADLLGFAALTEANEIQIDKICNSDIICYQASDLLGDIDKLFNSMKIPSTLSEGLPSEKTNQLTMHFIAFHNSVKHAVELAQMSHSLTAITFSDSAFFVTSDAFNTAQIAINLMQSLMWRGIPLRAAIAYGTFVLNPA